MESREEQILRIAAKLFGTKGYDRTSLRDIADVAGITKAALYYYFPDKEALYDKVVIGALESLYEFVATQVTAADSPSARLNAFIVATAQYMGKDRWSWMAGSNTFWAESDRKRRSKAIEYRDRFERLLTQCIQDLIDAGLWRSVDPKLATRFILGAINQIPRWHSESGPLSVVAVVEQYLDFITQGLKANGSKPAL